MDGGWGKWYLGGLVVLVSWLKKQGFDCLQLIPSICRWNCFCLVPNYPRPNLQLIPEGWENAWKVAPHLLTQSDRGHLGGEVSTSVVPHLLSGHHKLKCLRCLECLKYTASFEYLIYRATKSQTFDLHNIGILAALGVSISENHLLSNSLFSPSQAEIFCISWLSEISHILISRIFEILRYIFNNSTTQCEHLGEVSAICRQSLLARWPLSHHKL